MNETASIGPKARIGVAGMGVMGANLAANIESRGFPVALWNLTPEKMDAFVQKESGRNYLPARTDAQFIASIERPRIILLMVTAGDPVDQTIERFLPLLDKGDILMDGGNTWYEDTTRREDRCRKMGIHFVGMGVSGGEEGARNGPSLMPGGTAEAYRVIAPLLEAIAAKTASGPCVTHVGKEGAGHFVKMVHNGIEYAQMQLIAESFDLLRRLSEWRLSECADAFARWNEGPRASFLMELTARVLRVKDEATGNPLVDMVVDKAGQKGTGNWTIRAALSLGVAVPTIAAAVDARTLSSLKDDRRTLSLVYPTAPVLNISSEFGAAVRDALLAAQIITWAQGMNLITAASNKFQWGVRPAEIARIWKGGCIIRSALLDDIMQAFEENTDGLLSHDTFVRMMDDSITGLRVVVSSGAARGVPLPAFSSALSYFDTCRTARLPQNLIQAQRDAFGAHTYQRTDDPTGAFHHSKW